MNAIQTSLQFQGTWRVYQKRVLDHASKYLEDGKVHIVAAPGSGKTTLGIELIRKLGHPCLILAPSITIRDQWISRIKEAFLTDSANAEELLSNHIRKPAPITAITYQALHSCMTRYKGVLVEKDEATEEEKDEEVDFSQFDFFATVKQMGFATICLDEAHHLRSEWWKALEEMMKKLSGIKIISLTATPPYDSTPQQWERYIGLCGPIDEEIIVPELVKEGSLCPHQDYVYFNTPTEEEKRAVQKFREEASAVAEEIFADAEFTNMIKTHPGLKNPREYAEIFLDHPKYFSSLLIFLNAKKIPFSGELRKLLGTDKKLPKMDLNWMEALLQGFLYDDRDHYFCDQVYIDAMKDKLKGHGCISKNKVQFVANDQVSKLLRMSKGKISSIVNIVKSEYANMGKDLRMLILTDYIKKEYVSAIGDDSKGVNELGVVPIFENIRRSVDNPQELCLGVLSGTIVIVPKKAKERLEQIMEERNINGSFKVCQIPEYYQVSISGKETTAASLVTELFQEGLVRVLIGTKSLLGEGWDSPCINSLILASFVGSFMLSNQMRGRAIRTMKGNPDKVSNIWHLVCMEPEKKDGVTQSRLCEPEESEDFMMLQRRFEGFLGLHYEEDKIENGLRRLSYIKEPFSPKRLEEINQKMLTMAADRNILKSRWEKALTILNKMEIVNEAGTGKERLKSGVVLMQVGLIASVLILIGMIVIFCGIFPAMISIIRGDFGMLFRLAGACLVAVLLGLTILPLGAKLYYLTSPFRYMKAIGKCMLKALQEQGCISRDGVEAQVEQNDIICYVYLNGGTEREKDVFAQCVSEFFDPVDNQRYLLAAKDRVPPLCKYYCVPEIFGKRKEDAEMFYRHVKKYIGNYELVYTRNGEGRKVLLDARIHAFGNQGNLTTDKKKKVKSVFE